MNSATRMKAYAFTLLALAYFIWPNCAQAQQAEGSAGTGVYSSQSSSNSAAPATDGGGFNSGAGQTAAGSSAGSPNQLFSMAEQSAEEANGQSRWTAGESSMESADQHAWTAGEGSFNANGSASWTAGQGSFELQRQRGGVWRVRNAPGVTPVTGLHAKQRAAFAASAFPSNSFPESSALKLPSAVPQRGTAFSQSGLINPFGGLSSGIAAPDLKGIKGPFGATATKGHFNLGKGKSGGNKTTSTGLGSVIPSMPNLNPLDNPALNGLLNPNSTLNTKVGPNP